MGIFNEDVEVSEIRVGKIDDGQKYITSVRGGSVSDDNSINLWFQNPATSSEDSFILVTSAPGGAAEMVIAEDVSQDGTGSLTTVLNAQPQVGGASTSVTRTGDSYTINGDQISVNIPGGSNQGPGSGGSAEAGALTTFLLKPGGTMLFRLTNRSGGSASLGLTAVWFEASL